eukprot:TRINITY_DN38276_c0_g1_i1.p1 TRINITY_DN38276_c0_g1~~TRINITY_DN38276_c0_g1_i1.p1  ORF type:complete len:137 (-),score=18.87 TRINITY_DN38276_c0_g1_i1:52-462(-)
MSPGRLSWPAGSRRSDGSTQSANELEPDGTVSAASEIMDARATTPDADRDLHDAVDFLPSSPSASFLSAISTFWSSQSFAPASNRTINNTKNRSLIPDTMSVSYTHLRAHETPEHLVCRLLLEKKKKNYNTIDTTR